MKLGKIDQMSELMRMLSDREFRSINSILIEETKVRGKLARLEAQVLENRTTHSIDHELSLLSAQILWQGWTTRIHRQLNTELAQITVKKLMALDRVRFAFGRSQAVELIQSAERHAMKTRRTKLQNSLFNRT